jgi:hypothetical protein
MHGEKPESHADKWMQREAQEMPENGSSAHVYRLDDGNFRLTFIVTSKSGAQFLSEIGDFTRWDLDQWFRDEHLHPSTDFDSLLDSFEKQSESHVPLILGAVLRTHFEDGALVQSPAKIEDVCKWMAQYQQQYFDDRKITIVTDLMKSKRLKATASFRPTMTDGGSISVSSELLRFGNCLKISLLHELIHANLHVTGKHDPDNGHGESFQAEMKRLMNLGAYDPLL